jgi:hypothetical protein
MLVISNQNSSSFNVIENMNDKKHKHRYQSKEERNASEACEAR